MDPKNIKLNFVPRYSVLSEVSIVIDVRLYFDTKL